MGQFAAAFMQKGGEYFTPASIVKLIVEVIEPYHGKIFDPACGSGGMFTHSADFVRRHHAAPEREISVHGCEKMADTQRLCRLNLAVHGLSGDIREANSYYDDPFKLVGKFDFVMANPPFNQSEVDKALLVSETGVADARFAQDEMTGHGFRAMAATLLNEMGLWHPDASRPRSACAHARPERMK